MDIPRLIRALLGQPEPSWVPITTQPFALISMEQMAVIVASKLNEINSPASVLLPDTRLRIYRKSDVMMCHELVEVSSLPYTGENHDCDDFAAELFGKFAGLVWTDVHALNFFVSEDLTFYFIEPQTKKIATKLDNWQGSSISFILGR
jgi:hypothetical protein